MNSLPTHSWVLQYSSRLHFTFSGSKVQGTLTRCRRESNINTCQPTAQELVSNLSGLLSSALTEGTRRSYQRAWAAKHFDTQIKFVCSFDNFMLNFMGPPSPLCLYLLFVFPSITLPPLPKSILFSPQFRSHQETNDGPVELNDRHL